MIPAAHKSALLWLRNRNGDGVFDRHQVLVAAGERAPYMRSTWSKLEAAGYVERYLNGRRLRCTELGRSINLVGIGENDPCDEWSAA